MLQALQGAPQLHSLDVWWDRALHLQQGSFQQLTALTSLKLVRCGLQSVPADIIALSATLCEVDLTINDRLQIDGAAVARIVACSRLRTLDVSKWEITAQWAEEYKEQDGYVPAAFSTMTVSYLIKLPLAFHKRHRRALNVSVG